MNHAWFQKELVLHTSGKGLREFTGALEDFLREARVETGLLHVFCRHTSCSLVIMENADPTARRDLEAWLDRLVPEEDPHFEHVSEGPDDMPSHIKMALTRTSEAIPVMRGVLGLGTWQGIYLWEHRTGGQQRRVILTLQGVSTDS